MRYRSRVLVAAVMLVLTNSLALVLPWLLGRTIDALRGADPAGEVPALAAAMIGLAFLQAVTPDRPGCLLLDVRMPGKSGLDLQRWLVDGGYELPVIFLTAHADVALTVRAMKAGAVDVFTKPFDDQTLLDSVQAAIERDRRHREELAQAASIHERYLTLSARERQVMALVVTGRLNKQIASELGTSVKTVKTQRGQMMRKMGAQSIAELVRFAVSEDLAALASLA